MFFVIFTHLYTQFSFLSCFSNAFSSVLFLYLFMNNSLLPFFRVLQNVFACIFFLLQFCFYNCNICVTFSPFYYRKVLQTFFSNAFTRKRFTFAFCSLLQRFFPQFLYLMLFCIYICKCSRYRFAFFRTKCFFKRFFCHKGLFFLLCLSNVFFCNFYTCCNFVFIIVKSALLFPFCYRKIFG